MTQRMLVFDPLLGQYREERPRWDQVSEENFAHRCKFELHLLFLDVIVRFYCGGFVIIKTFDGSKTIHISV